MDKVIAEKILTAMVNHELSWDHKIKKYTSEKPWWKIAEDNFTPEERESGFGRMFTVFGWNGWNDIMDMCGEMCGKTYLQIEQELKKE